MVRCVICGAAGRMGRRLVALVHEDPNLQVTGAVERADSGFLGEDAGELAGVGTIGIAVSADLPGLLAGADVAISFVNDPAATIEQASVCAAAGTALVVGTTGLTEDQDRAFRAEARGIPVVKASNFSVGITTMLSLVEHASRLLGDQFDCEIIESHHTKKKDSPSGTAFSLAESAAHARGWTVSEVARHGREGFIGERPQREIGIHAVRAGDIVGHHTVLFGGTGETLELTHRAQSRDTFVMGALRAAKWIVSREPSVYDMRDVLGLT